MSKTNIFLSSTCFDLKALREHLRERIRDFGHDLLASEHPSFPVSPELSTVDNCKKVIRDHADLLVLIVGGQRGNLDGTGMRSVVNAEYVESRAKGIDSFVFIDKQVWDLLPIYEKNKDADFSPTVDYPEVFKFIAQLKAESRWIYTFSNTEEIITTLRTQLSVYLRTLIERSRRGSLIIPREFLSQPRPVLDLIQERPPHWEYLLTAVLFEGAVVTGRQRLLDLKGQLAYRPTEFVPESDVVEHIQALFDDLRNIIASFDPVLQAIPPSWGPPGIPGDPIAIYHACKRISLLIEGAVEWETKLRFLRVPEKYSALVHTLRGSTEETVDEVARVPRELRKTVAMVLAKPGAYRLTIDLKFKPPSTLQAFTREMDKLKSRS